MNYDLNKLHENGKINDYFYHKLDNSWLFLNSDTHDEFGEYISEAMHMTSLGVSNPKEELIYRRISHDVPDIIQEIADDNFDVTQYYVQELMSELYKNQDKYDMTNLVNVFCSVADAAKTVGIPISNKANYNCSVDGQEKIAYPQFHTADHTKKIYDISRWMQATKDIYLRMNSYNESYDDSFSKVTANWDKMEKLDFKHWIRFYQEGVPEKYPKLAGNRGLTRTAQGYMSDSGFYLPPAQLLERMQEPKLEVKPKPDVNEIRDRIESQRSKILSRLLAAEKLLTSLEGQNFAGEEQEFMLKLLQDLKRKVQIANKISIKSSLFHDLVSRAGNYMQSIGSRKGKDFFYKVAQMPDPFAGAMPPDVSESPIAPSGDVVEETRQAFRELREMYEKGFYDSDDDQDERKTASELSDIVVLAQEFAMPPGVSIGESEVAPPQDKPRQNRPKLEVQPEEIVVTEDEGQPEGMAPEGLVQEEMPPEDLSHQPSDNTADVIEAALNNITIQDAINRLEVLVGIYKKREVPRQLSILDIMMDQLGIGPFFPSLGEAQSKALESTQYISTRLEDILAKLKGSVESSTADAWVENRKEHAPETMAVQNDLQEKQEQEAERKALRKEKANQKLDNSDQTEVGQKAEQELAQPTKVETAKPLQVR